MITTNMNHNNEDFLEMFEARLCEYTGAPYAVVVDRCTNAILLSLKYLDVYQISVPRRTYMSVPMTCMNYGLKVTFNDRGWEGGYKILGSDVYDYAVGFEKNMYIPGQIQCLSFHQKKRLNIGKGGAILLNDEKMYNTLRRMRHDGRDSRVSVSNDSPDDIIIGYHMNMSPDEAVKGMLLMNQLSEDYTIGTSEDYDDLLELGCFGD